VITVNGEPRELTGTVDELLDALGVEARRGLAVAVDATVVPRGEWATTEVSDGARVEIVTAVQGG
jgi:sulfur carrier protein